jgi:hypothetical protein
VFPHGDIHKYARSGFPCGKDRIVYFLICRTRHSSILHVGSFNGADCDTDHYLIDAEVRETLAVRKITAQEIDMDIFNLKKLEERDVKEQYQVTTRNKFCSSGKFRGQWGHQQGMGQYWREQKFLPKKFSIIVNRSIVNRGLLRNVQSLLIKGSRLNHSGCRA